MRRVVLIDQLIAAGVVGQGDGELGFDIGEIGER